jgi:hypothetical protein
VPWYWWPLALAVAAVPAVQVGVTVAVVPPWLPVAVLPPATLVALWWFGRLRIAVTDAELLVDDARLPRAAVSAVIPLDADGRRELLGPHADPLAFVVQRPWISGAVQVVLDDPADPTPYWLVSARAPARLAAALRVGPEQAARDATPQRNAG